MGTRTIAIKSDGFHRLIFHSAKECHRRRRGGGGAYLMHYMWDIHGTRFHVVYECYTFIILVYLLTICRLTRKKQIYFHQFLFLFDALRRWGISDIPAPWLSTDGRPSGLFMVPIVRCIWELHLVRASQYLISAKPLKKSNWFRTNKIFDLLSISLPASRSPSFKCVTIPMFVWLIMSSKSQRWDICSIDVACQRKMWIVQETALLSAHYRPGGDILLHRCFVHSVAHIEALRLSWAQPQVDHLAFCLYRDSLPVHVSWKVSFFCPFILYCFF